MAYLSSSEDEFPPVEIVIQRQRHKISTTQELDGDKENAPTRPGSPGTTQTSFSESIGIGKTPATARRRRRLGQGQPVANSLRKPWNDLNPALETGSKASSRDTSMMTTSTFASDLLDRLPVKAKRAESRLVSGATMFDSPPQERKKTRRLISRGEKKAQELKVVESERNWLVSDDDAAETNSKDTTKKHKKLLPSRTKDDDSEFILGKFRETGKWDSDSDDLSGAPPGRSQSPSAPRRLQKRVLSSSNEPSKNFTQSKIIPDDPEKSPKKRPVKQPIEAKPAKAQDNASLEDALEKLRMYVSYSPNRLLFYWALLTNKFIVSFNESPEPDDPPRTSDKAPVLEPITPRKTLAKSPTKAPIIPLSPWKPEHKEFWDPEANFTWIDKHSPPKRTTKKIDLTGPDGKEEMKRKYGTSPEKKQAKKSFDAVKEDLARTFLLELDETITQGKLGQLTESTGGLRIDWSNTLLTTAGRAHWKCKTTTTTTTNKQQSGSGSGSATTETKKQHYASIELATKVLSNESDLLNTVAHEFCHLAVFLLHGKPKLAHGPEFKSYGQRVSEAASASSTSTTTTPKLRLTMPRERGVEIEVTTRHSYDIEYRYVWRCVECAAEIKRYSRSVNPERHGCGSCHGGKLMQVKPVPRGGSATIPPTAKNGGSGSGSKDWKHDDVGNGKENATAGVGVQKKERKKSAYQEFTSREMKALSVSHKGLSFKEKMALVSSRWSEHQKNLKEGTSKAHDNKGPTPAGVECLVEAVEILDIED